MPAPPTEVASASVEKILKRWQGVDGRVSNALSRPRRRPKAALVPGRRMNRPNASEEEVRWRLSNPDHNLGELPSWSQPSPEPSAALDLSTKCSTVARVSTVT